jgi:hypothetical protein
MVPPVSAVSDTQCSTPALPPMAFTTTPRSKRLFHAIRFVDSFFANSVSEQRHGVVFLESRCGLAKWYGARSAGGLMPTPNLR